MLGRGGILLCPRGFPAVTVRLKLRDGAAKSPCTCGLDSEIYNNRLKQRKNRKKISVEEWNASVAEAMKVLEQSEQGKINDEEMRKRFEAF